MRGEVYGRAGGSLTDHDVSWAVSERAAQIGGQAEVSTGDQLDRLADAGFVVMHDLDMPRRGYSANIDHVVLSGRKVLAVDSKAWKPGTYWTLGSTTRRGTSRVKSLETTDKQGHRVAKQTQAMIFDMLTDYLPGAEVLHPVLAVWSSSKYGEPNVLLARVPGARVVKGSTIRRTVRRTLGRARPVDPDILEKMLRLVRR